MSNTSNQMALAGAPVDRTLAGARAARLGTGIPKRGWGRWGWLAAGGILLAGSLPAQEALRGSMAATAAAEARRSQLRSPDYTFKSGDFRMLVKPSLGLDYNDNINLRKDDRWDDFILRPLLQLTASYPITQNNLLFVDIGVGYDKYFDHDEYSQFRLNSGSQISFDVFIKAVHLNLHDRFQYTQDSARESSIAGTGFYGYFDNTIGLSAAWELKDISLAAGYDHYNRIATEDAYSYQDQASEMFFTRAGFLVHPQLTVGVEGTVAFTTYDQPVLNDNTAYSAGVYGEWRPGTALSLVPRIGYTYYQFDDSSAFLRTGDVNSWYFDLTLRHDVAEAVSYSISAGHQLRLGVQSDIIDEWYVRPMVTWRVFKNISLNTYLSYEHGNQGEENLRGNLEETYDWFGGGVGANWPLLKRLTLGLNYRLTIRSSDLENRDYTQNLVGLLLTYKLQ